MFDLLWSPIGLVLVAGGLIAIGNAMAVEPRAARWLICFGGSLALAAGFWQASEQRKNEIGDGYCYLLPINNLPPWHNKRVTWMLMPPDKYPLHDVRMLVSDLGAPGPIGVVREFRQTTVSFDRVNPGDGRTFDNPWPLTEGAPSYALNIAFQARNGSWYEAVRFRPKDGGWAAAIRVYGPNETLLERNAEILDKDPKTGQPIW